MNASRMLIIVCGNAGVGKTTFGQKIAAERSCCLLDIDTVSERLVRVGLAAADMDPDDRDSPSYKRMFRDAIHQTLFDIARQNLLHESCVIVAPFTRERRDPNFLRDCAARVGASVLIYYLTCEESVRKNRILARGNPRDANKLADWEQYSELGRDSGPPPFEHVLVRTDGSG